MISQLLLFGAGASKEAGIPTAFEMTVKIQQMLSQSTWQRQPVEVLNFVVDRISQSQKAQNLGDTGVNVEEAFNGVATLAGRKRLDLFPFVESWHPKVSEFDGAENIDEDNNAYEKTMAAMIQCLKKITWIEENNAAAVKYLLPLFNVLNSEGRLIIATLNYDNAVELAAISQGIECDTKYVYEWNDSLSINVPEDGLFLLKLHGSIDWRWTRRKTRETLLRDSFVEPMDPIEVLYKSYFPAVIFGHKNKLTASGPFLDMLLAFRAELSKAEVLTVVGYSFADEHINVVISSWLNSASSNKIQIINGPNFEKNLGHNKFVDDLFRFSEDNPGRIIIIDKYAGEGLLNLFG